MRCERGTASSLRKYPVSAVLVVESGLRTVM